MASVKWARARQSAHLDPGHAGDRLGPAERLLAQRAFALAGGIARVPRRATAGGRVPDLGGATCGVTPMRRRSRTKFLVS